MFFKKFVAFSLICGFVIDVLANNQKMKPFINLISEPNSEGYFKEGTEFKAQCVVFNGEPMWNFSKPQDQIKISDTYILHNKIKEIQFHLTPKHNKMVLMCSHSDSPDLMDQFIINVESLHGGIQKQNVIDSSSKPSSRDSDGDSEAGSIVGMHGGIQKQNVIEDVLQTNSSSKSNAGSILGMQVAIGVLVLTVCGVSIDTIYWWQ